MIDSARATADEPIEVFLGIASEEGKYPQGYRDILAQQTLMEEMPTVAITNYLADEAMKNPDNKLFMIVGDDAVFATKGWDTALKNEYDKLDNKIHVFSFKDSRSSDGTPHPIVTREFIDTMGYFCTPIFLHFFVDTWLVEMAKNSNCFTKLDDYLVIHDKGSDKGQSDETHTRLRNNGYKARDFYVQRKCQHFLDAEKLRLFDKIMETI
jgi:hypothetical protein